MSINIDFASELVERLLSQGVSCFCLCPGARNAPFVAVLAANPHLEVVSFFDERSAGFYAMGRAKKTSQPVAIITTSGTAVSELLSATIEAWHSHLPLVLISADRPKSYRGTGAPQTMDQAHLFKNFVEGALDIEAVEKLPEFKLGQRPFHLNICFDEPLLDGKVRQLGTAATKSKSQAVLTNPPQDLQSRLQSLPQALIVVGGLDPSERQTVAQFLRTVEVPIFLESASGLRAELTHSAYVLKSGDQGLCSFLKQQRVQSVVRIGDVPVGRFWRDLEVSQLEVLSLSSKEYPGLTHGELFQLDFSQIDLGQMEFPPWDCRDLLSIDHEIRLHQLEQMQSFPLSEVSWFKKVAEQIPHHATVFVGNSLPVREWEWAQTEHPNFFAARGVNGIDGQLSTALGLLEKDDDELWVVLGDLTALYDFSGFWLTQKIRQTQQKVRLIVVNNGGGQIFSRLFQEPLFRNEHQLQFQPMAAMWGWSYHLWTKLDDVGQIRDQLALIELVPELEQTQNFWQASYK